MRRYVLASLAVLLIACGGDNAVGPELVAGSYALRTVNGNQIPAVFYQDNQEKDEFVDGSITLASDNSWTGQLTLRGTDLASNEQFGFKAPISGTFSLRDGAITLTDALNGLVFTGTVGGGTLSLGTQIVVTGPTSMVFHKVEQ